MRWSIKQQMVAVFIGLTASLLAALLILNAWFLEPFYIHNKQNEFVDMYNRLNEMITGEGYGSFEASDDVLMLAERNNISFLFMDAEGGQMVTNVYDMDMLNDQLMGYLLNQMQAGSEIIENTDNYQIVQSKDPRNKTEYIEMWGSFDDGSRFLMRSPLESIQESVALSNKFLVYVGCVVVVICAALAWYLSRRITGPLRELAALSEQMANLDFNAKYTRGGPEEIEELGANFNRMSKKLEVTVSELKHANNSLQKDIERKEKLEEMRSEFLGNVSHELKTPIALIQGYAEGLREGISENPADREFYCDVIMDEAAKMNQMVKNLMTLNQLEFGDEEIDFERFDLTEVTGGVLQSMEIMAQQKGAQVIFRQEDAVYVWGDAFKVEQVVRNYVSNAYNHLDGEQVVEVRILKEEARVRVTVFNTGAPIPEEDIPHIWDKFYKVDKAHTREYGGNGIGLSIVKAVMNSLRQEYGVNNYDNGVEFWFTLDVS